MENALDQALRTVGNALGGAGKAFGEIGHNAGNQIGQLGQQIGQDFGQIGQPQAPQPQYRDIFQPQQQDQGFWSPDNPVAQGLANIQPHVENFFQGATLGYYTPPAQDQQGMNPFVSDLEKGVGGIVPFAAATLATGGAADAFLAPEVIAAMGGRGILATAGGGLLTGGAAPAANPEDRLKNALTGGLTGAGFGALGEISNPLIKAGVGSLSMAGIAALQGGDKNAILANAVMGLGTPLFFKATESMGGGDSGHNLMNNLWTKFGTDSYRFLANKDLIQRVVTGQGSPEDIQQFNILNNLGELGNTARSTGDVSIEDTGTRVPKQGPVWEFLQTMFPGSFENGAPTPDFTDPAKSPLSAIPQMTLDANENDALMQIDENNPNPNEPGVIDTKTALEQKLAEEKGTVPTVAEGEKGTLQQDVLDHAQDLISPEGKAKLADVYKKAAHNRPVLDQLLDSVGQQTGGNVISNFKDPDTLLEKTVDKRKTQPERNYGLTDVNDVVRGRIVYNNMDQIANAVEQLKANLPPDVRVVKEDDFFKHPRDLYQGYHVDLKFPNGQQSEVQFHTWKSYAASMATHGMHEAFGDSKTPEEVLQQKQNVIDQINKMSDEQAQQYAESLAQQAEPKQAAGADKVQQVIEGQPVNDIKEMIIEAYLDNQPEAAADLHRVNSMEFPQLPSLDEIKAEADQRSQEMQGQTQQAKTDMVQQSIMKHPDVAQHKLTIRKAARVYNLLKAKGVNDIATITQKVPGLDVALDSLRDKGVDVQDMEHLVSLSKELPKKSDSKVSLQTPATKPEALAKVKLANDQTKIALEKQPVEINGTHFTPDALPQLQQFFKTQNENGVMDQPGFFAQQVLPQDTWKQYLAAHPDINNHDGGPDALTDEKGYFAFVDPKSIQPNQSNLDNVVDHRILEQLQRNEPFIVKANRDGTFKKIDGQHRLLAARTLGANKVPAIILDDKSSDLEYAYQSVKQGASSGQLEVPFIQGKPAPTVAVKPIKSGKVSTPVKSGTQSTRVITDPSDPNYDFAKDMEFQATQSPEKTASLSDLRNQEQVHNAVGSGETSHGGNPPNLPPTDNTPTDNTPEFTQQPKTGYVKELQPIVARITQGALPNYPSGRDFTKIILGRKTTNNSLAGILQKWVQSVLPDVNDRNNAYLASDNSIPKENLTPQQKLVVEQLSGLNELIGLRKQEMYPGLKLLEDYSQRIPVKGDEQLENPQPGRPLSETVRADFHRNIWKFVPEGGDGKAKQFIASTASPKFKLQQTPEDRTLWIDPKTQQSYRMTHAPVAEIEKELPGVEYEKDIANVSAQSMNDFLNQKDFHFAKTAIEDGIWKGKIAAPGEPAPPKARLVDVKGLEGWKADPEVATSLENLAHDQNISKFEQGYDKAENFVTQLVFYNALKHPFNMLNLAMGFSGQARSGNPIIDTVLPGPYGMGKLISTMPTANTIASNRGDVYWALKDAGSTIGTFGKTSTEKFIGNDKSNPAAASLKAVGKYNPASLFYRGNRAIVGHVDDVLRTALTKTYYDSIHGSSLTDDGMHLAADFDPEHLQQAVSEADKNMVDYGNLSRGEKRVQRLGAMFYPWLKGLVGGLGRMAKHPIEYRGSIQNFALMALAGYGATMAWKQFTGNPDASVDQYGMNKFMTDIAGAPGQVQQGRIPTLITSHLLRPILKEAVQQGTNRDLFTGKQIYDPNRVTPEDKAPETQTSLREQHALSGLIAPAQPFMKVGLGKTTPVEAATNFLGLKTPHATGYEAAPKLKTGPLSGLNAPGATKGTGIAALNVRDQINGEIDAGTRQKISTANQLLSQAYNEGNPIYKMQAYSILTTDPTALRAKSLMEVSMAKANGTPINPLWELGVTDPGAQKVVMQYKSLLPADQKNFKSNPQQAAILNAYNAMASDYYKQLPVSSQAKASGIQPPTPSKDVSDLLTQYDTSKKAGKPQYSLLDDPRVQSYFSQLDFYDGYINNQFGLTGANGSGGSKSSYSGIPGGSYGPAGTAAYMDRSMERAYAMQNLQASAKSPTISLTLPKPAAQSSLHGIGSLKQPSLQTTVKSGIKLGGGQTQGGPTTQKLKFNIQQPKYTPVRLQHSGQSTIM